MINRACVPLTGMLVGLGKEPNASGEYRRRDEEEAGKMPGGFFPALE